MTQNQSWGGRFQKSLNPKTIQFNASLLFDFVLYPYDILGSQAHAKMLAKQGLITQEEGEILVSTLADIEQEIRNGEHPLDENAEDIHMFIEQILIAKIGDIGRKLHTGRSRNDQVALDLRLYARNSGEQIANLLTQLCQTCQEFSQLYTENLLPGYTHLQQAQPISLGQYFGAYLAMFARDLARLQDWQKRMNFSPLGAGALAGSRLPLDRHFVAQELGFTDYIHNTLDAVSDRDYLLEFCSFASICMVHLSRLSEDLILWATQEFGFITLDDAFATGSSLMPNKKNPDILELIRGKSGRVFGHLFALLTMMKALPLAYNKDMQEDKEGFFDTVKTLTACLDIITPFLQSLQFNFETMLDAVQSGYSDATYHLEDLVLAGVPFRTAHHQIGQAVAQAMAQKKSLKEIFNSSLKK